ncbi:MAG: hypothetical protein K2H57_02245 [Duncaniella sp.]|nr:hypothetical protein [Duncaniella sp.]
MTHHIYEMTNRFNKIFPLRRVSARLSVLLLVLAVGIQLSAQRRVTPVQPTAPGTPPKVEREKRLDRTHVVEQLDASGNTILVDTVTGQEVVDSLMLPAPPKMEYPLLHEIIGGVNLWSPIMRAFGQHYGLGDVWAEVSLHNRYFPFLAIGVDNCNDTPDGLNFTFRVPVSPYVKIGASYNFLYNSNPDYKLQMGLRYGFTTYKWNVDDITVNEGYWNDPSHFSLLNQKSNAGYLEITFGLKVKIIRNWSLGWNIIYHSILHETKNPSGKPMFIPGYGKRGSAVTGSLSLMYTLPINKKKNTEVNIMEEQPQPPSHPTGDD